MYIDNKSKFCFVFIAMAADVCESVKFAVKFAVYLVYIVAIVLVGWNSN